MLPGRLVQQIPSLEGSASGGIIFGSFKAESDQSLTSKLRYPSLKMPKFVQSLDGNSGEAGLVTKVGDCIDDRSQWGPTSLDGSASNLDQ